MRTIRHTATQPPIRSTFCMGEQGELSVTNYESGGCSKDSQERKKKTEKSLKAKKKSI